MATAATVIMQPTCNLTSLTAANFSSCSSARCGALRTHNKSILSSAPRRRHQCLQVRAAVDKSGKDSIDRFAEGVKSDASKNSKNFGQMVSDAVGDAEETVKDVGRDMGAKTQEALDAVERKLGQAGDKAQDVGQEVKGSTRDTFDSAADTTDGQSITVRILLNKIGWMCMDVIFASFFLFQWSFCLFFGFPVDSWFISTRLSIPHLSQKGLAEGRSMLGNLHECIGRTLKCMRHFDLHFEWSICLFGGFPAEFGFIEVDMSYSNIYVWV